MMATPPLPSCFVDEAAALLRQRTGFVIADSRRSAFETSLVEAMFSGQVFDPVVFLADLAATPALMDELAGRCTIGETYFFREPEQFSLIEQEILPALLGPRTPDSGPLRIWSAGCATGEEPYTLAILAAKLGLANRTRIVGTDISRQALARARRARYTRWSLRGVPQDVVEAHFRPAGDEFELYAALRNAVQFQYLNLADKTYPSSTCGIVGMDLILCRNVLIYFDRETIARVAARLVASLAPDGWLVLGSSDPLLGELVSCDVVVSRAGLVYRCAKAPAAPISIPRLGVAATTVRSVDLEQIEPQPTRLELAAEPLVAPDAECAVRCYAERDYERAVELARAAVWRDGADPALWVILVRGLANLGELADAERWCAASLERHATCAELQCLHALLLNDARRYEAGAVAARRAMYLDRDLAVAHLAHGAALAGRGDAPGARRAFAGAARRLAAMAPDAVVPFTDGERADSLAELARAEIALLVEAAA